jgi:hypothetical protein
MTIIPVPSFLDVEAAYRREQITRDWGRSWFLPRRAEATTARRGGQPRGRGLATSHVVAAAR